MLSPERTQDVRHHRLHTEGEARDPGLPIAAKLAGVDRLGVALDRHLGARQARDGAQDGRQLARREQRGRAAPEEDR